MPTKHPWVWQRVETDRWTMGTDDPEVDDDERPARLVTVGSFAVAAITVADFAVFAAKSSVASTAEQQRNGFVVSGSEHGPVAATELCQGADWRYPTGPKGPPAAQHSPVVQVSWFDARAFCHWGGVRLPTEAEWVAAVRSGAIDTDRLHWCEDWYSPDYFRDEQRVNPTGPTSGTERVIRGRFAADSGSTGTGLATQRLTKRSRHLPDYSDDQLSFVVVTNNL